LNNIANTATYSETYQDYTVYRQTVPLAAGLPTRLYGAHQNHLGARDMNMARFREAPNDPMFYGSKGDLYRTNTTTNSTDQLQRQGAARLRWQTGMHLTADIARFSGNAYYLYQNFQNEDLTNPHHLSQTASVGLDTATNGLLLGASYQFINSYHRYARGGSVNQFVEGMTSAQRRHRMANGMLVGLGAWRLASEINQYRETGEYNGSTVVSSIADMGWGLSDAGRSHYLLTKAAQTGQTSTKAQILSGATHIGKKAVLALGAVAIIPSAISLGMEGKRFTDTFSSESTLTEHEKTKTRWSAGFGMATAGSMIALAGLTLAAPAATGFIAGAFIASTGFAIAQTLVDYDYV
jgi:hypothetical protein